jgi:hypothetical protein
MTMTYGDWLKARREQAGLSQERLAQRLLLALGRVRWDGSVRIVYAPAYRPLIPQPTVITPRYRPGVDEWIVELDAG